MPYVEARARVAEAIPKSFLFATLPKRVAESLHVVYTDFIHLQIGYVVFYALFGQNVTYMYVVLCMKFFLHAFENFVISRGIDIFLERRRIGKIKYLEELLPKNILAEIRLIEEKATLKVETEAEGLFSDSQKSKDSKDTSPDDAPSKIFLDEDYPFLKKFLLIFIGVFLSFVLHFAIDLYFTVNFCTNIFRVLDLIFYFYLSKFR